MRPLSALERRVLAEITWDGRASCGDVANRLDLQPHTVRRTIQKLHELLDFKPRCWTNPFVQGHISNRVYFSVRCHDHKRVLEFTEHLRSLPGVTWLAALVGQYQYSMAIRSQGLAELADTFRSIDRLFGDIVIDKHLSSIIHFVYFAPWQTEVKGQVRRELEIKTTSVRTNLDELDGKVLEAVRHDPLGSMASLARKCGIPTSTASYRFANLVDSGTIVAFGFAYSDRRAGFESFMVSIATSGFSGSLFEVFHEFARQQQNVFAVGRALGQWDVEIGVEVENPRDIDIFVQKLHAIGGSAVRTILVHSIRETLKG